MSEYSSDEELVQQRYEEAPRVLRSHWRKAGWEAFSPEEFYPTWGGIWRYAWWLLVCNLRGHRWTDSHYDLYGEPSNNRDCERCRRCEILKEAATS